MKLKALLLALFVAGFTASFALADDGHGKGDGKGKGDAKSSTVRSDDHKGDGRKSDVCRPSIELELRGTVAGTPTATSLAVLVTRGGAEGASLAGKQLTLDSTTASKPATLKSGDAVKVDGRACVDIAAGTVKLVANRVRLSDAAATTSSTTTTTTSTTTTTVPSTSTTTTTAR